MRKIKFAIALLLVACVTFCAVGCEKYPPVKSSKEEAATVMTLRFEKQEFNVPYELFRTLFLTYRDDFSAENGFSPPNTTAFRSEVNERIIQRICDIYAVFALCKKNGMDLYSFDVNKTVSRYIEAGIEGGSVDGRVYEGCGSYENYLDSLKELYMNYSVQDLMLRYGIGQSMLNRFYGGTKDENGMTDEKGASDFSEEDLFRFYDSDDCIRVLWVRLPAEIFSAERVGSIRNTLAQKAELGEDEAAAYMINFSVTGAQEIKNGHPISKNSLDPAFYSALTDAAFRLEIGEVSAPIEITDDLSTSYYLLYRGVKNEVNRSALMSEIESCYIADQIGSLLKQTANSLNQSVQMTSFLNKIDYNLIAME